MGLKSKLLNYLYKNCPEAFVTKPLSYFGFQTIAVDISIYANKYKAVFGDNWFVNFKKFIAYFKKEGINAIYIFDGKSPIEKNNEKMLRKNQKEKLLEEIVQIEDFLANYHIGQDVPESICKKIKSKSILNPHIFNTIELEEYLKKKKRHAFILHREDFHMLAAYLWENDILMMTAKNEAETYCAQLAAIGQVDAVLSDDSDLLAYGTKYIITHFAVSKTDCIVINSQKIFAILGITNEQFIDIAILCGTDYNNNLKDVGPVTAIDTIKQYGNIENFLQNTNNVLDIDYNKIRKIYSLA